MLVFLSFLTHPTERKEVLLAVILSLFIFQKFLNCEKYTIFNFDNEFLKY